MSQMRMFPDFRPGDHSNVAWADPESRRQFVTSRQTALRLQAEQSGKEDRHIPGSISGGLWDYQLDYYARLLRLPNYQEATTADNVRVNDERPLNRIVNYSISKEEGTHWVAIFSPNHTHVVYLDSYGMVPDAMVLRKDDNARLREVLAKIAPNVIYQNVQLQSENTYVCGYYCIYFLYWMNRMLNAHSSPGQIHGALKTSREHLFAGKRSPLVRDLAVVKWVNTNYGKPPSRQLGRYNNMKRKNIEYRRNPDTFAGQPV